MIYVNDLSKKIEFDLNSKQFVKNLKPNIEWIIYYEAGNKSFHYVFDKHRLL